jgi:uncharacterized membrane protein
MAGIGFTLKKVIQKGTLGSFIKAALSGTMIVAGPWIISIFTIILIKRIATVAFTDAPQLFIAVIVYTYSFSLIFFGGFHYIYTRLIADLMFEKQNRKAASLLLFFSLLIGGVSLAGSFLFLSFIDVQLARPLLFRISGSLLFTSANIMWLLMLFISLVTWYGRILISYAVGMGISIGAMFLLGRFMFTAGALLGFAVGHIIIVLLLFIIAFKAFPPQGIRSGSELIIPYIRKYRFLFLTGYLYYIGLWIDKIIFWVIHGNTIAGTILKLYEPYDIAVYLATLTMIPGLVFFVIFLEPSFYIYVKKFLLSLTNVKLRNIKQKKYIMLREMKKSLSDQSLFQGVITLSCIIVIPVFVGLFPAILTPTVMGFTLAGVFFHLLFLTSMNLHFYLEFYRYTYLTSLIFACLNGGGALFLALTGLQGLAGANYLLASVAASVFSLTLLLREGKKIDRYILAGVKTI